MSISVSNGFILSVKAQKVVNSLLQKIREEEKFAKVCQNSNKKNVCL